MKVRVPKTIRNVLLWVVVLIVLFAAAGIGYVFLSGDPADKPISTVPVSSQNTEPATLKPRQPNPNATESAAVEGLMTPVRLGSNTSISIKTLATSKCTIEVSYNGVASKDSGLGPKIADAYGNVTWAWTVENTAAVGTWPVKVTCGYNGRSAFVQGDLQVIK